MKDTNEVIGRFMVAVGAIIMHPREEKILLVRRTSVFNKDKWEFVFGRINQGEELLAALEREVSEEVGLPISDPQLLRVWHIYRGEAIPENEVFGMTFVCRTTGDTPIISDEHSEFYWATPEEALEKITVTGIRQDIALFIEQQHLKRVTVTDLQERGTTV